MKRLLTAVFVASLIFILSPVPANATKDGVTIIVSDWNDFFTPPPSYGREQQLTPVQWRFRLPFYSVINDDGTVAVRDDNQATFDQELGFAAASGIDAMAYFFWDAHPLAQRIPGRGDMNYPLRLYRNSLSPAKNLLKFCIIAPLDQIVAKDDPNLPAMWYSSFIPHVVDIVKDPHYLKVNINGKSRPLIFIFRPQNAVTKFGGDAALKKAIFDLRQAVATASGEPYLVNDSYDQGFLTRFGLDAQSGYTANFPTDLTYSNGRLWPYSELAKINVTKWNNDLQYVNSAIPTLNVGWDNRPYPPSATTGAVFAMAKPDEIVNHIGTAVKWIKDHSSKTPAKAMIIYAWAENTEGGWLAPTIYEGDARLQAIAKYLKGANFTSPRFKGFDLNSDQKVDIFDRNQIVRDFGKSVDPIPLNADITADGKVDINDYNALIKYLGK